MNKVYGHAHQSRSANMLEVAFGADSMGLGMAMGLQIAKSPALIPPTKRIANRQFEMAHSADRNRQTN
ncbi:MAG: hypothetical protein AB7T07_14605 [Steroidobacteraceae bacterium]